MKGLMITAPNSNSGKTLISMGIIRALKKRNIDVSAFKSGPDFIDRKYIKIASGKNAGNLDIHLMGKEGLKESLSIIGGDFAIIEGAMGYFDGISNTYENSSYDISATLDLPAILVYVPKGEMFSAVPKIKGMVDFSKHRIKGVILNKTGEHIYRMLKEKIEEYVGIPVLGYLPVDDSLFIDNRHLGLIQPDENKRSEDIIERAADLVEKHIELDKIIDIAAEIDIKRFESPLKMNIKVAVAYDEAFNFYYEENIKLLEEICSIEYFSPIKGKELPKADLVYIGGGYPELYKEELSSNHEMMDSIRAYVGNMGHLYAEGGGLMYLSDMIEEYPMCGIIKGRAYMTERLQNFGYVNIELSKDTILGKKGFKLTGQEFHRSILETNEEEVFNISKPISKRKWGSGYSYKNALGVYQHINFLGNKEALEYLLQKAYKGKEKKQCI